MSGNIKVKLYVGLRDSARAKLEGKPLRDVFRAIDAPTWETHGKHYNATIGPFRTRRGAEFMRDHGAGNPHCRCVSEAETLAKLYA